MQDSNMQYATQQDAAQQHAKQQEATQQNATHVTFCCKFLKEQMVVPVAMLRGFEAFPQHVISRATFVALR